LEGQAGPHPGSIIALEYPLMSPCWIGVAVRPGHVPGRAEHPGIHNAAAHAAAAAKNIPGSRALNRVTHETRCIGRAERPHLKMHVIE